MPQPTRGEVHVDYILTNISVAFMQQQSAFIAPQVFPVVPVDRATNRYFVFDQNPWFRDEMQRRPPNTESAGSGYTMSTDSYSCDVFALHKDIPDQVRANSDVPLNPDRNATEWLTQMALLRMEVQWQSDYFKTGVWTTDVTPAALWDNYATSDPIADIRTGVRTILVNTGFKPNRLVLGYDVWLKLQDHPDVVDRMKITDDRVVTPQLLGRVVDVDQVIVCQAVKATNNEGGTAAYAFVHGKNALLAYAAPNPALEVPSAGYTFMWTGVSAGMGANVAVSNFRMEHLNSDRLEIEAAWDNKVVSNALGYFFNGAVS